MSRYTTFTSWLPPAGTSGASLIPFLTSSVISTQSITDQITRAEGFIDSFVGRNYSPTDIATSPMITMIAEDIVSYRILENFGYNTPEGLQSGVRDQLKGNYNTSLNILEGLRDGLLELFQSDGTKIGRSNLNNTLFISTKNYQPTFDLDHTLNWEVSPKRLDAIDDAREADNA